LHWLLIKGILTGFILSLPFGPVGIFCMEKTLSEGQWKGYVAALGMITVDLFYTTLVLFFMEQVDFWIIRYELLFQFLVGFLLLLISVSKMKKKVKLPTISNDSANYIKNYSTTFLIALSNVSSLFTIWLIFTTLRIYENLESNRAPLVILGVLSGGAFEWFLTTYVLTHWKKTLNEAVILRITRIMGIIIFCFGLCILIMATKKFIALKCLPYFRNGFSHHISFIQLQHLKFRSFLL
jgi:threonine/homoserine/homoserine lactone efflux protein